MSSSSRNEHLPYRSIDFKKYIIITIAGWTFFVALMAIWTNTRELEGARKAALESGRAQIAKDVLYRRWNAFHQGVYVPVTESTQPNPHLSDVEERDIETPSGKKLTLINPAFMTRQVHELGLELEGVMAHITSLNPIREANKADEWETRALQSFEDGGDEFSSIEVINSQEYLRIVRPLATESGCLKCHEHQGYKLGDIRGGLSVSIPMKAYKQIARDQFQEIMFELGGIWLVGVIILLVGMQQMTARNKERIKILNDLKENGTRHQAILKAAMDGFWITDMEGKLLEVNDTYCSMSGYSREELLSMSISDLEVVESKNETARHLDKVKSEGQDIFKSRHSCKDGKQLDVQINVQYQSIEGGRYIVFIRDISGTNRTERIIDTIQEGTVNVTGKKYFHELIKLLSESLGFKFAYIAKLKPNDELRTVAVWIDGEYVDNFNYHLKGTPCKNVIELDTCFYPQEVQQKFPEDELLAELGVESYLGTPLKDTEGRSTGLLVVMDNKSMPDIAVARDVLEMFAARAGAELGRRDALRALKKSEEQNRLLYENMAQGVFYQAANGYLADANPAALRMFGLTREEVLSRTSNSEEWKVIHEDGTALVPAEHPSMIALQTGKPVHDVTLGLYNPKLDDYVWLNINAIPQFKPGGDSPYQVFVTMHDLTQRRRVERDYHTLFNEMLDGFALHEIICNQAGEPIDYRFLSINPAFERLTGLSAEGIVGKTILEVIPTTEKHWIDTYGKVALTGEPISFENHAEPLGKHFQVTAYRPVPMQFATIFVDITERKEAEFARVALEKQLMQSQKLETVGTMVGGISHELNNVLQSMFLYGGLIQDDVEPGTEIYEHLQQLLDDGERARDLVNQILTFSRKSEMQLIVQPIDEIIRNALNFKRASLSPNIQLVEKIDPNGGSVLCDSTQIHQIIINLCNNAEHAIGDESGSIEISLKEVEAEIEEGGTVSPVLQLKVVDTGQGMSPEIVTRIFDPFFTTKEIGKGTGLGLSVIYGIVNMMQGSITVDSELNEGSTFTINFPLADKSETEISGESSAKHSMTQGTILLVDDESSILSATQEALKRKGFEVDAASEGDQALELFKSEPGKYDYLVTDLSMPGISGSEMAQEIRKSGSDLPIILSTGHIEFDDKEKYTSMGVTDFIQKPWAVDELLVLLQRVKI